jgi:riboflavin kinase / FMN adenylyltransferase
VTDVPAVVRDLADVPPGPSVVTIGNFDGVHRGHQVLLKRAVDAASERGARSVAVTFDPHPAAVLRPGSEPVALQPIGRRCQRVLDLGIDLVVVLPFTRELSQLTPDAFVERVLAGPLQAVRVIVGTNFRFGHKAAGDVVTLVERGEIAGFEVEAVTLLDLAGDAISSTAVRDRLADGDVEWATEALGRPHEVTGVVEQGDGRGRTIGVPTANVAVPVGVLVPANGVYAGHLVVEGAAHPCVTNVGTRPTFAGEGVRVEAHVLDAPEDLDLYGRTVTVTFEHRLRGEQRFEDVDALVAQIRADVATARDLVG